MLAEAQTKAADVVNVQIPDYVKGFIYQPALLEDEDPSLYWKMVAAIIDERKPVTVSDWIALNDLATKVWEERVFARASNALIRGGKLFAVQQVLREIVPGEPGLKRTGDVAQRACKYFSGNEKERNEIRSLLAKYEITEAELHARAAQHNCDAVLMFERMRASRERGRRKLRKEDERLRVRKNRNVKEK